MSQNIQYDKAKDLNCTTCSNSAVEPKYVYEASKDLNTTVCSENTIPLSTRTWVCPNCQQINHTDLTIICTSCGMTLCECNNINE